MTISEPRELWGSRQKATNLRRDEQVVLEVLSTSADEWDQVEDADVSSIAKRCGLSTGRMEAVLSSLAAKGLIKVLVHRKAGPAIIILPSAAGLERSS